MSNILSVSVSSPFSASPMDAALSAQDELDPRFIEELQGALGQQEVESASPVSAQEPSSQEPDATQMDATPGLQNLPLMPWVALAVPANFSSPILPGHEPVQDTGALNSLTSVQAMDPSALSAQGMPLMASDRVPLSPLTSTPAPAAMSSGSVSAAVEQVLTDASTGYALGDQASQMATAMDETSMRSASRLGADARVEENVAQGSWQEMTSSTQTTLLTESSPVLTWAEASRVPMQPLAASVQAVTPTSVNPVTSGVSPVEDRAATAAASSALESQEVKQGLSAQIALEPQAQAANSSSLKSALQTEQTESAGSRRLAAGVSPESPLPQPAEQIAEWAGSPDSVPRDVLALPSTTTWKSHESVVEDHVASAPSTPDLQPAGMMASTQVITASATSTLAVPQSSQTAAPGQVSANQGETASRRDLVKQVDANVLTLGDRSELPVEAVALNSTRPQVATSVSDDPKHSTPELMTEPSGVANLSARLDPGSSWVDRNEVQAKIDEASSGVDVSSPLVAPHMPELGARAGSASTLDASSAESTFASSFVQALMGQGHHVVAQHAQPLEVVPAPAPIAPHQVRLDAGQVQVEVVRLVKQGGGQVVMELTPPDESKFKIDLSISQQGVARLVVDGASESTRLRLEQTVSGLQEQFQQMGLQLQLDMRQPHQHESRAPSDATPLEGVQGSGRASRVEVMESQPLTGRPTWEQGQVYLVA